MFGNTPAPQSEKSILSPESPYGNIKVYAYHITKIIETLIRFLLVMEYCSIMKAH